MFEGDQKIQHEETRSKSSVHTDANMNPTTRVVGHTRTCFLEQGRFFCARNACCDRGDDTNQQGYRK
jgi:hypothetical protein